MKLLFLNHNPVGYGTYWRVYNFAKYLADMEFEVSMICASNSSRDAGIERKREKNFEIITLPRFKYGKYMTGQEIRLMISVWQTLTYSYDIVHAFTVAQPQIAIPALAAKYLRFKKLVIDWDDAWHDGFALYHRFPVRNVLSHYELSTPKHADAITVASKFLYDKSASIGIETQKITYIPNGCNIHEIKQLDQAVCRKALGMAEGTPILLSMGHTYAETMEFLLDAFRQVRSKIPNAKLILLSKLVLEDDIKRKIDDLQDSVTVTGEDTFFCLQIKKNLQKEILYSPDVVVYHHRRRVFLPHLKQIWGYGTHRGYFAKKFPYNSRHPTYFVPSLFVVFNVLGIGLSSAFPQLFLVPYGAVLGVYFAACIATGIKARNGRAALLVMAGIPLTHFVYGAGFLKGLATDLKH